MSECFFLKHGVCVCPTDGQNGF